MDWLSSPGGDLSFPVIAYESYNPARSYSGPRLYKQFRLYNSYAFDVKEGHPAALDIRAHR